MTVEDELLQLRAENRRQQEQIRVQQEQLAKQEELIAQLQQRIHVLEERLTKNSRNSHLPPSSDRFVRQPKSLRHKSGKKPGGQEGHAGSTLTLVSCPDEVIVHAVACCQHCQQDLAHIAPGALERRQVFDLPQPSPRLLVREHQAEHKQCPACQQITVACFPHEVRAPVQYGAAIGASGVYLVQQQLLPLARACEVMEDLLGVAMSEGTLCELIARGAQSLREVEQQVKAALIQAEVLHHDETGVHVLGKRQWVHVTCTATLTHYQVHASRGHKALEAIGILPLFHGISLHDGWRAYWRYACEHAACNVHVVRELTFLADEEHLRWAADLKAVLLDMKAAADAARSQGLTKVHPVEVVDWEAGFLELLAEGEAAHPLAHAPPGHRGRPKQSPARNLLTRLRTHQQAVLPFLEDLRVPFDNNQAERDLRMVKVQQNVSGGFRSAPGAVAFCRIRGYLSCLRKQGLHLLSALEASLRGHPVLPSLQTT
jgi:transposase